MILSPYFPQKIGFDISWTQFAWNVNTYFVGENKKKISECCLFKFLLSVNTQKA